MISVPFSIVESHNLSRITQPINIGFPFAVGVLFSDAKLAVLYIDGRFVPCQVSPLTFWHDGSIKWAMIDFIVDITSHEKLSFTLTDNFSDQDISLHQNPIKVLENDKKIEINTGLETFSIGIPQGELLSITSSTSRKNESENFSIELTNSKNEKYKAVIDNICVDHTEEATHRKCLTISGNFNDTNTKVSGLKFESTLTFFANTTYIKLDFTLHNPQAAIHPGGLWDLGDESSIVFKSLSVNIPVDSHASVNIDDHISNKSIACGKNTFLKQFSSGGGELE